MEIKSIKIQFQGNKAISLKVLNSLGNGIPNTDCLVVKGSERLEWPVSKLLTVNSRKNAAIQLLETFSDATYTNEEVKELANLIFRMT